MRMHCGALIFLISAGLLVPSLARAEEPWPVRLREPRIAPLPEAEWGEVERAILLPPHGRPLTPNVFTTLVRHPAAMAAMGPFGQYLLNGSTLPARDREILMLRIGWLCQAGYEWGQHARIARDAGLTDEEIHRIAEGPEAEGWSDFERTLLRAADDLHYEAMLSDATWEALQVGYSLEQTIDAILTVGQYKMVSMALNSFGVQLDEYVTDRLPADVPRPEAAGRPTLPRPETARVQPLQPEEMNETQRALLQPFGGNAVPNGVATLLRHPKIFVLAGAFQSYLMRQSTLPDPVRRKMALRVLWLTRCDTEWEGHARRALEAGLPTDDLELVQEPDAGGDDPLIRAADKLVMDAFIDDGTWEELTRDLDTRQMMDLVFMAGGQNITAMLVNSLGVQPGAS